MGTIPKKELIATGGIGSRSSVTNSKACHHVQRLSRSKTRVLSFNRPHLVRTVDLRPISGGAEPWVRHAPLHDPARLEGKTHNWYNRKKWRRGRSAIDPIEAGGRGA